MREALTGLEQELKSADVEVTTGDVLQNTNHEDRYATVCFDSDRKEYFLVKTDDERDGKAFRTLNSLRVYSNTGSVKLKSLFEKESNVKYWEVI